MIEELWSPAKQQPTAVTGDDIAERLLLEPDRNCVGIAALEALGMINAAAGRPACGVALELEKVREADAVTLRSHCDD